MALRAAMKLKVKRRYIVVCLSILTLSVVMIHTYSPLPCEQKCLLSQEPYHNQPPEAEERDSKRLHPNIRRGSWNSKTKASEKPSTLVLDQHRNNKLHETFHFSSRINAKGTFVKLKQGFYKGRNKHFSKTYNANTKKMFNQTDNGNDSKYASHLLVPRHDQTIPQSAGMHSLHPDIKPCRHKCTPDGPKPFGLKWKASVGLSAELVWASKGNNEIQAKLSEKKQHHTMVVSGEGAEVRDFRTSWCETLLNQHFREVSDQSKVESLPWFSKDDMKKMNLLARGTVLSKARIPGHGQVLQVGLGGCNESTAPITGDHNRLCQTGQCAVIKRTNDWFEVLAFHLDRVLGLNRSLPVVLRTFQSDLLPYKYTRGSGRPVVWWDPDIQHLSDDYDNDQNSFPLTWPQYQDLLKARCGMQQPLNSSVCLGVHHSEWGRLALFDFLLQVNDRLDRCCCGFQPDPADICVENHLNVRCANPKDLMLVHILVRRTDPSRLVFIDNAGRPHHPEDNLNFRLLEGIDEFPERAMSMLRSGCLEELLLRSLSVDKELWESRGGAAGLRATMQTLQHRAQILLQHLQNKRVNSDL